MRKLTHSFDSKVSMFKQGDISKGEFLEFTEKHEREMEKIILRYDNLQIPQTFASSVELFKLSSETQLESDKHMMEWIMTGDETATLAEPFVFEGHFICKPGEKIHPYECELEEWASTGNTLTN